jgi:AcrR family transcriptional regulator
MQSAIESVCSTAGTGSASSCPGTPSFPFKWNNAFLSAVLLVGTGGFVSAQTVSYVPSGALLHVRVLRSTDGNIDSDRLLDTQEKLAGIRHYLSMTVTDLAKVLRVGRPTVYAWLRDGADLRAEHAQRLESIYRIARKWRMMSSRPVGAFLNQPLTAGETLRSLLSERALDELAIQSAFSQIRNASSRTTRRPSVAEVAKQRGFKLATTQPPRSWSSDEDLDV